MPVTRTNILAFGAGLVAGAVAYATYPRWKGKVSPLVGAVIAGASAAARDARATAQDDGSERPFPGEGPWRAEGRNGNAQASPMHI